MRRLCSSLKFNGSVLSLVLIDGLDETANVRSHSAVRLSHVIGQTTCLTATRSRDQQCIVTEALANILQDPALSEGKECTQLLDQAVASTSYATCHQSQPPSICDGHSEIFLRPHSALAEFFGEHTELQTHEDVRRYLSEHAEDVSKLSATMLASQSRRFL